jgi:hypothetical protein
MDPGFVEKEAEVEFLPTLEHLDPIGNLLGV